MKEMLLLFDELTRLTNHQPVIFRGEPEDFGEVTSNLYRELRKMLGNSSMPFLSAKLDRRQSLILEECQRYCEDSPDQQAVLEELQHYGGNTNLIDFTTDYRIALFFACDSSFDKQGRVICLPDKPDESYEIRRPDYSLRRAEVQKSVFVQASTGTIPADQYTVMGIPSHLKPKILDYLWSRHAVFAKSVYCDIHGYLNQKERHLESWFDAHEGQEYLAAKDFPKAIKAFTSSIEGYYHWPVAYNMRGYAYLSTGKHHKAIADFNQALNLDPQYALAFSNRGETYMELEQFDLAILDYYKAIEFDPNLEGPYIGLGRAYQEKGVYDKCANHYIRASELAPDNILVWLNIGSWRQETGQLDEAIQDYDVALLADADAIGEIDLYRRGIRVIDFDGSRADVFFNRGLAYFDKGLLEKAIDDFKDARKLKHMPESYCLCGLAWLMLKEEEEALAELSTARDSGVDVAKAFTQSFQSIGEFERIFRFRLRSDVQAFLQDCGTSA